MQESLPCNMECEKYRKLYGLWASARAKTCSFEMQHSWSRMPRTLVSGRSYGKQKKRRCALCNCQERCPSVIGGIIIIGALPEQLPRCKEMDAVAT